MVVTHASMTGADEHEPKGITSANSGEVYVADGASSGTWTDVGAAVATNSEGDGFVRWTEATITAADLDSAGTSTIIDSSGSEQYKIREIILSGAGTNYGSGGNRTIDITDGTTSWSIIPNATIESLAAGRWGDTAVAWPASASDINTASVAGTDIYATYAGGTTDHSGTGSLTLLVAYERTA